jgi:hypothetical protein
MEGEPVNEILGVFAVLALLVVFAAVLMNRRVFGWMASVALAIMFAVMAANEESMWRWAMLAAAVGNAGLAVQSLVLLVRTRNDDRGVASHD